MEYRLTASTPSSVHRRSIGPSIRRLTMHDVSHHSSRRSLRMLKAVRRIGKKAFKFKFEIVVHRCNITHTAALYVLLTPTTPHHNPTTSYAYMDGHSTRDTGVDQMFSLVLARQLTTFLSSQGAASFDCCVESRAAEGIHACGVCACGRCCVGCDAVDGCDAVPVQGEL